MSTEDLITIATIHGSDKWNGHWYAQHYERHFAPWRFKAVRLLEIGIGGYGDPKAGGQSLRMWKQFFPLGTIVGLDIFDKSALEEERIRIYRGSQTETKVLRRIVEECGPFDLIVDDGSHRPEHVIATFEHLFQQGLKDDGIYAVEDLQTSYWRAFGGKTRVNATGTSMAYFKALCDGLNFRERHHPAYRPSYFDLNVTALHFYHNLILIQKGANDENSNFVSQNRVSLRLRSNLRFACLSRTRTVLKRVLAATPGGASLLDKLRHAAK